MVPLLGLELFGMFLSFLLVFINKFIIEKVDWNEA